ncbi:MAG: hypothetical protein AAF387_06735 [Pseudomonadota bacterium]
MNIAKTIKFCNLSVAAFLSCISLATNAVTLDFESLSAPGHPLFPTGIAQPYEEDGFKITTGGGQSLSFYGTSNSAYLGSIMLFNNTLNPASSPAETKIETVSGNLFSISEITLAKVVVTAAVSETFVGTKADDSTVQVTFNIPSGTIASTITSFFFPNTFVDLKSVSWFQSQASPDNRVVQIDNVVVSAVPLPPALLLFTGGALWLVRRRRG